MAVGIEIRLKELTENTGDMALKRRARNIILGLGLQNNDRILDVGCGDGYYLHLLSDLGLKLKLSGTDYDENGLNRARKNIDKNIILKQGDLMHKLPFKNDSFDKVVMSEVAEHLPNDVKGLKEINRVMVKGGIICLTVPNANYPLLWDPINKFRELVYGSHFKSGFWAGIWNQHERLYTPEAISRVVSRAGFEVIVVRSLTFWSLPFNHYLVNLVARGLASGSIKGDAAQSLSKYTKNPKRKWYLDLAFQLVNLLDNLNDVWTPKDRGVAVFIKAIKK